RLLSQQKTAEETARKRVLESPQSFEAHKALADLLNQAHNYPEAIREYQIALSLNPRDAATQAALGQALDGVGPAALAKAAHCPRRADGFGAAHRSLSARETLYGCASGDRAGPHVPAGQGTAAVGAGAGPGGDERPYRRDRDRRSGTQGQSKPVACRLYPG